MVILLFCPVSSSFGKCPSFFTILSSNGISTSGHPGVGYLICHVSCHISGLVRHIIISPRRSPPAQELELLVAPPWVFKLVWQKIDVLVIFKWRPTLAKSLSRVLFHQNTLSRFKGKIYKYMYKHMRIAPFKIGFEMGITKGEKDIILIII